MDDRLIMARMVKGKPPGREFDVEFWQALGPTRIWEAAWDLVVTAAAVKGIDADQLRLQRSVTKFERGRHLIVAKAAGRPQDLIDLENLTKAWPR
jgi:hypothetical protein